MKSKNHMAVIQLKLLGYPLVNIRKALHKLTGITQPEMSRKIGTSRQNITLNIDSSRGNPKIQARIAEIWNVPAEELFENSTRSKQQSERRSGNERRKADAPCGCTQCA